MCVCVCVCMCVCTFQCVYVSILPNVCVCVYSRLYVSIRYTKQTNAYTVCASYVYVPCTQTCSVHIAMYIFVNFTQSLDLHSLHLLFTQLSWQMPAPPHALHSNLRRICSHTADQPHSLHWLFSRLFFGGCGGTSCEVASAFVCCKTIKNKIPRTEENVVLLQLLVNRWK